MLRLRFTLYIFLVGFILMLLPADAQSGAVNPFSASPSTAESECQKQISAEIFPAETCSVIASHLAFGEQLGEGPLEDGSFMVVSTDASGKSIVRIDHLPPRLRSEIALKSITESIKNLGSISEKQSYPGIAVHGKRSLDSDTRYLLPLPPRG